MIKLTHSNRSHHSIVIRHGRKSISVDRIPLTLAPFYRDYIIEMQNCRSDPALQGSRSPKPASTVTSITSRISTASKPQQTVGASGGGGGGGGGGMISCLPADQAARRLRRAIEKNSEARAERLWTERNFPRLKRSRGTFGACVGLLDAEEEKESAHPGADVVGREVAPHQFVLSFNRTKGKR